MAKEFRVRPVGLGKYEAPYRKFKFKKGYFYIADFKDPESPCIIRKHFGTKAIAEECLERIKIHPFFRDYHESFIVLTQKEAQDLNIRVPKMKILSKFRNERYPITKYPTPPGLTRIQRIQFRNRMRSRNIYSDKKFKEADPLKVIDDKPVLFITRYVRYYRDYHLSFSNPINCWSLAHAKLKKLGKDYPSEYTLLSNIIRVLDRFYPGRYSRIRVAIKLYKRYGVKITLRIARVRKYRFENNLIVDKPIPLSKVKPELLARGFVPRESIKNQDASYIGSIDGQLILPIEFNPIKGEYLKGYGDVYTDGSKYSLPGQTRVLITRNRSSI